MAYRIGVESLGIWESYIFPSPINVIETLIHLIADNTLGIAIIASMRRMLLGYSISVLYGIVLGLVVTKFKYLDKNLSSLILGLQTLPSICWLPFAILWYGINERAIIFIIVIGSTFAITMGIQTGIKNINPLFLRAAKTMGAGEIQTYWNVILPASLPSVISGMKQGWSFAWRALIAGEMMSAPKGLGHVLMMGRDLADISQVMAVMIVIIALGLIIDKLVFERIEKNILHRWGLDRV